MEKANERSISKHKIDRAKQSSSKSRNKIPLKKGVRASRKEGGELVALNNG